VSYNRPIIQEIYADLYLHPGTLPLARFFDLVPQLGRLGFPLVESAEPTAAAVDSRPPTLVRCWSEDRLRLVQIAPDNVIMNLVSPDGTYPGWSTFVDHVARPALSAISAAVHGWSPQSVSLNTLDRAVIHSSSFRLGDYLNCGGPRIPAILADTVSAFDYDIGRGALRVDGQNRQIHIHGGAKADDYVILVHSVFHERVETEGKIIATLQKLHDESNTSFESLITPRMRNEIMKGTNSYASSNM
jgi:uncharacterized protein (TIGR04255 family)